MASLIVKIAARILKEKYLNTTSNVTHQTYSFHQQTVLAN